MFSMPWSKGHRRKRCNFLCSLSSVGISCRQNECARHFQKPSLANWQHSWRCHWYLLRLQSAKLARRMPTQQFGHLRSAMLPTMPAAKRSRRLSRRTRPTTATTVWLNQPHRTAHLSSRRISTFHPSLTVQCQPQRRYFCPVLQGAQSSRPVILHLQST